MKNLFVRIREKLKGWKTIIIGAIVASPLTVIELLEQLQVIDPESILPEPWGKRVALGIAIVMILMRLITSGPVGSKGKHEADQDTKAGD